MSKVKKPKKPPPRNCTTIGIWRETLDWLDRICAENAKFRTRAHRRSRQEELDHLVLAEAVRQKLIEAES